MSDLHFAPANRKLKSLEKLLKRKLYSFSTLSGYNCPFADKCQSFAVLTPDGLRIKDGKHNEFRCFSASQEVLYRLVYDARKRNELLLNTAAKSVTAAVTMIRENFPVKCKVLRLHIAGDFKTQNYFDAWLQFAIENPNVHFYAYTKSIPFWVKRLDSIPNNFILTASIGGKADELALANKLRTVTVYTTKQDVPKGLPVDHNDKYACLPRYRQTSFALLEHGTQKGRKAQYGYGKMKGG